MDELRTFEVGGIWHLHQRREENHDADCDRNRIGKWIFVEALVNHEPHLVGNQCEHE